MFDEKIVNVAWSDDEYWYVVVNPDWSPLWSAESFNLSVAQFKKPGYSWVDKFWKNPQIDQWSTPEDIWDFWGLYNFTVNGGANYFVSSNSISDTQEIEFDTLTVDSNWNWNRETFTQAIAWQTKTQINSPSWDLFVRFLRCENVSDLWNDIQWDVYIYEDSPVSWWVPSDSTKIRWLMQWSITPWLSKNQTQMCIFTIPTGKVWFLLRWESGLWRNSWTDQAEITYVSKRFWKVQKVKKDFTLMTSWNSTYKDVRSIPDPIPAKTDLLLRCINVSANNTSVWGTFDILLLDEDKLSDGYLNAIWQIRKV